ncbi:MAG: ATP-binding cassette domain-containing protein [Desulfurococcales archaeon]|nr:ATP-binding cassette domain-containing protein [Desulfurococcales archaeon]
MNSSNDDCIISVKDLTKVYDQFTAVDHISFCVKRNEIFGFLGPNGAGKTTTVRMLVGLTKITLGKARIDSYDIVKEYKDVRRIIGVVPDISNLYSELTSLQNLLFSAEMYGVPKDERLKRAGELLKFFGLWGMKDFKFKDLSKGLKRRLTIAAALTHNPKILFLDEPTAGLDVMSRRMVWKRILELNKSGVTIFLTTHNVYEAFHICDRISIINKGKLVASGTPGELSRKFSAKEVVEVAFQPRNPSGEELAENLKGALSIKSEKDHIEIVTSDPIPVIEGLINFAKLTQLEISILNLRGADAEELFLKIVGEQ